MGTLTNLHVRYLTERLARGEIGQRTAKGMRYSLRSFDRSFGNRPLNQLKRRAVLRWLEQVGHLSPATRRNHLSAVRGFCRWLVDEGHLPRDITARIAKVRVPPGEPRDFTDKEVAQVISLAVGRDKLIVLLMACMGLRCGDVSRVRVEDLEPRSRMLRVRGKGGRGEVTHEVPVPSIVWDRLIRHIRDQGYRSGPVFRSVTTGAALRPDSVGDIVSDLIDRAGLKLYPGDGRTPHALRHTFATGLVDGGADLRLAQHALGHRTIRSTELYVRREPAGLREAMEGRSYLAAA